MLYKLLGFEDLSFPAGLGWHHRIKEGLPLTSLDVLAGCLEVTSQDLAALLGVTKEQATLTTWQSDCLFKIAVAFHRLHSVFKDNSKCALWLRNHRKEVHNAIPLLFLLTPVGADQVLEAVERMTQAKQKVEQARADKLAKALARGETKHRFEGEYESDRTGPVIEADSQAD